MQQDLHKELEFLNLAEKLKTELRHSWLSNGRAESVAEHSWRLALMAFRYADRLAVPVNVGQCLKLALVHDLAEAKVGDIPIFDSQTEESKKIKYDKEHEAMQFIRDSLGDAQSQEMYDVWLEYENQITYESKFIKALDKLEAFIQHIEADLSTWEPREKRMLFQDRWLRKFCSFDPFLNAFCDAVLRQGIDKLKAAGENISEIEQLAKKEN